MLHLETGRAELEVVCPSRLYPLFFLHALGGAFQAAGEAAGCKDAHVDVDASREGAPRYAITWR